MTGISSLIGYIRSKSNERRTLTAGPCLLEASLYINSKSFGLLASGTFLGFRTGSTTILIISFIILGTRSLMYSLGVPKKGLKFTSINHILKSSSRRKSKPKSSKTFYRGPGFILRFMLRKQSITRSLMRGRSSSSTLRLYCG